MKLIPENSYLRAVILGMIVSACVNSVFFIAQWWSVSPYGSIAGLFFVLPLVFPLLVAMISVPLALLAAIPKRTRKKALQAVAFMLVYVIVAVFSIRLANDLRMHAFAKLAERSAPLVDAIRQYETEHGQPPVKLPELIPEYLPAIPSTGMKAYPEYEYLVGEKAKRFEGNPWVLLVNTPSGGINFDMFIYFPGGNYPERAYGSVLERIGDWAYCHE